jgi:hypothetical protein
MMSLPLVAIPETPMDVNIEVIKSELFVPVTRAMLPSQTKLSPYLIMSSHFEQACLALTWTVLEPSFVAVFS